MLRNVLRIGCVLLATACAGSSGGGAGDGGGVLGASVARGTASITLGPPSDPSSTCPAPHTINVPYDPTSRGPTVTASSFRSEAIDSVNGATVQCTVRQNGTSFDVNGRLQDGNSADVLIVATIAPGQDNASGAVAVSDADTQATFMWSQSLATSACTFSVKPAAAGETLGISSGRIWARVTCTDLVVQNQLGAACNVPNSYILFENCGQ